MDGSRGGGPCMGISKNLLPAVGSSSGIAQGWRMVHTQASNVEACMLATRILQQYARHGLVDPSHSCTGSAYRVKSASLRRSASGVDLV